MGNRITESKATREYVSRGLRTTRSSNFNRFVIYNLTKIMVLACSEVDVVFLVDTGQHIDARCNPLQTSWNALPLKRGQFYFLVLIKNSNLKL